MPRDVDPVIALRGLTKHYGTLVAVRSLTLDVVRGEVFGFLGLNGAGKTTTIRILLDLLRPTSGTASVFGFDCQKDGLRVRGAIGYLPGDITFYSDMTGAQVLALMGRLGTKRVDETYRDELLQRFNLSRADLGRRIREYSTGMKRKLGLVQALQADAELLILDEPTEGLDPLMQEAFYALLSDLAARGRTVFMSSHILSEVERVCDRVAVLRKGELTLAAKVEEVRRLAPRRVHVTFDNDVDSPAGTLPDGVAVLDVRPRRWSLTAVGPLGPLVSHLASMPVADISIDEAKLEDVLIDYYREAKR